MGVGGWAFACVRLVGGDGGGGGGGRLKCARALERIHTYTPEWTKMSLPSV